MISDDDLDRFSEDLAAHVLDGHARGLGRCFASEISIGAGLVVEPNPKTGDRETDTPPCGEGK
jgi:hypothetical protein